MMRNRNLCKSEILIVLFLILFFLGQGTGQIKLKVIVDDARVNETPEINGKTLARLSLNTILDSEGKEGEWYKVSLEVESVRITGYMHEILVEAVSAEDLEAGVLEGLPILEETQEEIIVEIQSTLDESRELIRSDRDLETAVVSLRPLIAKAFRLTDDQAQRELAAEIFLWIGMAYAGLNQNEQALEEIRNMFEVDYLYAKKSTRNIFDPKIVSLIHSAESAFLGKITEYSIEIVTNPENAQIKINGKEAGSSPGIFKADSPIVKIEITKDGYKSIQDEFFLTLNEVKKEYALESLGRNVAVRSNPPGAKVYLNGKDTGEVTNCMLPFVPFGEHTVEIVKEGYVDWTQGFTLEASSDPYTIDAVLTGAMYEYLMKWGGANLNVFKNPQGITLDENNTVVVVDESKEKLRKFTTDGKPILNWAPKGSRYKGIENPSGVAVDSEGYVYVTDVKEHCVWKFDKMGNFIKTWGKEGIEQDEILRPTGISINSKNEVYIVDSGNLRVKVYSSLGVFQSILEKPENMGLPVDVAVGPDDHVWILDKVRVYKFSPEGNFISAWGERGSNDGEFGNPKGIAIDRDGYIYIADAANSRIQKFDSEGKFITKWGEPGTGIGRFNLPSAVAVDKDGLVYVSDSSNNRIQVFKIAGQEEP
jgi:DNA-binding beta-propeller fold protein YncE